ncbi:class I SAM-dependent methyltransferase [Archangium violaceum]|uniref:class I SAM-dependent methyltransferase n=1 Tax=Archangium violaceum TaxID=83451 RepID=UPI002B2D8648|nr:class I SAM-dependent methyltransferase [Archangium violaceum]
MNLRQAIVDHYGPVTAQNYDQMARTLFWAYPESLEAMVMEVRYGRREDPSSPRRIRSVLDLGIGTGNLSLRLATALLEDARSSEDPPLEWVGFDASPHMMTVAESKLGALRGVRFLSEQGAFTALEERLGSRRFDCIVSSYAIHHLDGAGKAALFRVLHRLLEPGGLLVVGDKMPPPGTEPGPARLRRDYHAVLAARCLSALRRGSPGLTLPQVMGDLQAGFDADGDQPSSVEEHVAWLREAGFQDVRSPFFSFGCAVVSATK